MELQLIGFRVGEENYALDILTIVQIIRFEKKITIVPRVAEFIEGIINLRGNVVPLIDLRKRFGCPVSGNNEKTRIVIIRLEGYTSLLGLIVDSVHQVLRVESGNMLNSPDILESEGDCVKQVVKIGDILYMILDVEELLSTRERKKLEKTSLAGIKAREEE